MVGNVDAPEGAKVHFGFLRLWESVGVDVKENVTSRMKQFPDFSIWFTGHSKTLFTNSDTILNFYTSSIRYGRRYLLYNETIFMSLTNVRMYVFFVLAVATLAAVDFLTTLPKNQSIPPIHLLTFAQPRLGNTVFSQWVSTLPLHSSIRVVNMDDLTPHLPPTFAGFAHVPEEMWVADESGTTVLCREDSGDDIGMDLGVNGREEVEGEGGVGVDDGEVFLCETRTRWRYDIRRHSNVWNITVGSGACK
jgi:hypothetical protein